MLNIRLATEDGMRALTSRKLDDLDRLGTLFLRRTGAGVPSSSHKSELRSGAPKRTQLRRASSTFSQNVVSARIPPAQAIAGSVSGPWRTQL